MTRAYVITESKTDAAIIKKLLPPSSMVEVEFVVGSGSYAAQSLARTILSLRNRPVALILDADTMDNQAVQEKYSFLHQMLRPLQPGVTFEVLLAIPAIEGIFCYNKSVLEKIIGHPISEVEWHLAQAQPKQYLEDHIAGREPFLKTVLTKLTEQEIKQLRQHPLISRLYDFLVMSIEERNKPFALAA